MYNRWIASRFIKPRGDNYSIKLTLAKKGQDVSARFSTLYDRCQHLPANHDKSLHDGDGDHGIYHTAALSRKRERERVRETLRSRGFKTEGNHETTTAGAIFPAHALWESAYIAKRRLAHKGHSRSRSDLIEAGRVERRRRHDEETPNQRAYGRCTDTSTSHGCRNDVGVLNGRPNPFLHD